jgi:hypothetical protein
VAVPKKLAASLTRPNQLQPDLFLGPSGGGLFPGSHRRGEQKAEAVLTAEMPMSARVATALQRRQTPKHKIQLNH